MNMFAYIDMCSAMKPEQPRIVTTNDNRSTMAYSLGLVGDGLQDVHKDIEEPEIRPDFGVGDKIS
jgi:hypothetical protein